MSGTPKPLVRWLTVDAVGEVRTYRNQPNYQPGRAVFKLNITLPASRYIDGEINLSIPEADVILPEVEYVEPMESLVEQLRKRAGVESEPEEPEVT